MTNVQMLKGTVASNGCPEVSDRVLSKLNEYAKTILFDTGKFSFKNKHAVLQAITAILKNTQLLNSQLVHTDSIW